MKNKLSIRLMKPGDEKKICELIHRVFSEHVAPHYEEEGIQEFMDYVTSDKLTDRSNKEHFVLVAESADCIVGVIEIRENNHISLFFSEQQGIGVGRELLNNALSRCLKNDPKITAVTVNSSPNAVSIYERLGFAAAGPQQNKNGIVFTPMNLKL